MNIGIDLDGVVFDTEIFFRAKAEIFHIKTNGDGMIAKNELLFEKRYDWTCEKQKKFFDENFIEALEEVNVKPCAKEVIELLKSEGHNLICITGRGVCQEEIPLTLQRLERESIHFDKLYFSQSSQLKICKEEKIDFMVDDYYNVVDELSQNGIKCLYFNLLVNKHFERENVAEVKTWGDVLRQLKKG